MLKTAQLYTTELTEKMYKTWYDPKYIYYHYAPGNCLIDLPQDNFHTHDFVSVDEDNNVVGYIAYNVNYTSMSAEYWSIIGFTECSIIFAQDIYLAICNAFDKFNMNRIEWSCIADNPAIRGYRNFIKKHGGTECAKFRQSIKLQDGKLHDIVYFEILKEEFRR